MVKIHLIPQSSIPNMAYAAICSSRPNENRRQAVHTRREFNELPEDERCLRCDAIVNGRRRLERSA